MALKPVAWDPNHDILYGTDLSNLYTLNVNTGAATLVRSHVGMDYMIGIACDSFYGILYEFDLQNDALYTINTSTGVATLVGPLGINTNFGQDIAFDRNIGQLFLAGYNSLGDIGSRLYWIDKSTGAASKVGNFPVDYQMVGFAIPSPDLIPDLHIIANRNLNWDTIPGVSEYRIYGASNPFGTYTYLGSTPSTSWIEKGTPPQMRFYRISAVYAQSGNIPEIRYGPNTRTPTTANCPIPSLFFLWPGQSACRNPFPKSQMWEFPIIKQNKPRMPSLKAGATWKCQPLRPSQHQQRQHFRSHPIAHPRPQVLGLRLLTTKQLKPTLS